MFLVIQVVAPDFYASVWHEDITKIVPRRGRRLDGDRQFHHVPDGQFQDLSDGRRSTMLLSDGNTHDGRACWCSWPPRTLAFCVMAVVRVHGSVKRRAADIGRVDDVDSAGGSALAAAFEPEGRAARHRIHHQALFIGSNEETKVLRRRMIQAGIFDPRAVAFFFLGRTALAVGACGAAVLVRAGASRAARRSGC